MKRAIIILALLAVTGLGAFFLLGGSGEKASDGRDHTGEDTTHLDQDADTGSAGNAADNEAFLEGANVGTSVDATDSSEVTVSIDDFIFETSILRVKKGTKVTWVNNGATRHDIQSHSTSPKKGLDSELLANGESYAFTFDELGTYRYFCTPHPTMMRGIIEVVE